MRACRNERRCLKMERTNVKVGAGSLPSAILPHGPGLRHSRNFPDASGLRYCGATVSYSTRRVARRCAYVASHTIELLAIVSLCLLHAECSAPLFPGDRKSVVDGRPSPCFDMCPGERSELFVSGNRMELVQLPLNSSGFGHGDSPLVGSVEKVDRQDHADTVAVRNCVEPVDVESLHLPDRRLRPFPVVHREPPSICCTHSAGTGLESQAKPDGTIGEGGQRLAGKGAA